MTQYRTTKIPLYYFNEIEEYLMQTNEFVSVAEFIRDSIKEKLSKIKSYDKLFLIAKDVVFNDEIIILVHDKVIDNDEKGLLKTVSLQSIVNKSSDLDYVRFLSKFLVNFAKIHPFNDGNKRTSWTLVDVFLRLNNKKLKINVDAKKETKDEIFIWQNSANQKTIKDIMKFLKRHIVDYIENTEDIDKEIEKSIKENKLLLKNLSR